MLVVITHTFYLLLCYRSNYTCTSILSTWRKRLLSVASTALTEATKRFIFLISLFGMISDCCFCLQLDIHLCQAGVKLHFWFFSCCIHDDTLEAISLYWASNLIFIIMYKKLAFISPVINYFHGKSKRLIWTLCHKYLGLEKGF